MAMTPHLKAKVSRFFDLLQLYLPEDFVKELLDDMLDKVEDSIAKEPDFYDPFVEAMITAFRRQFDIPDGDD